jgi:glucose/arabinose dehydrogenase
MHTAIDPNFANDSSHFTVGESSQSLDPFLSQTVPSPGAVGQSLIFIDASVENYPPLLTGVAGNAEVFILHSGQDGIAQMSNILSDRQDIDSIHIVSHATSGDLLLGNARLNGATLDDRADQIRSWGQALSAKGDILLYGCNLADDQTGQALVKKLADLTDADIAASTDLTGNALLGGDWQLEFTVGQVDTPLAFAAAALDAYDGLLFDINFEDFSNVGSLQLNGDAAQAGDVLRLTPNANFQVGSAFLTTPVAIDADTSFQSQFQFQLSGGSRGADGFTFVLQNSAAGATAIGEAGGSLGYDMLELGTGTRIDQSLAIEFDTYRGDWDSNRNHISILRDGDVTNALATVRSGLPDLNRGQLLNAWVDYDGSTDQLDIFIASGEVKPTTAVLSHQIDLAAVVGNQAYLGFTAGTGGLRNAQDITRWSFSSTVGDPPAELPGITLSPTGGDTTVTEAGGTDTYTLVLDSQPTADVTIAIDSQNGQLTTDVSSVTFTPSNWDQSQTVTVTAVDDEVFEGAHSGTLTHTVTSADGQYDGIALGDVAIAIADNDLSPGVTISQTGGATAVTEGYITDTYTLVLDSQPTADVTLAIASQNGQLTTDVSSVTFTPSNWNQPQTVTVTAVDDDAFEGAHSDTLTHTITSADGQYDGLALGDVAIAIADNDFVGVTLTQTAGATAVEENGATDSYTLVLDSQPTADVAIDVLSRDGQVTLSGQPLIFTPDNWDVAQTITVTAVDDSEFEGGHGDSLSHVITTADIHYAALGIGDIAIAIADNDAPPPDPEPGFQIDFTNFSSAAGLQLNGDAAQVGDVLRLTPNTNFQVGSAFFTTPVAIDADTSFQSQFQFQLSGGSRGADGFTFVLQNSAAGANAIGEAGGSLGYDMLELGTGNRIDQSLAIEFDTYRGDWDSNRNHISILRDGDVTNALATADNGLPDLNGGGLLNAWVDYDGSTDQLDIFIASGEVKPTTAVLSHQIDLAAVVGNQAYLGFTAGTGGLRNAQDITRWSFSSTVGDPPAELPGITLSPTEGDTTVTEAGETDTYTLVLDSQPTADVTIAIDSQNGQLTTDVSSVTFTPSNWAEAQTVTVTAVDDEVFEGAHSDILTHTVTSADGQYDGIALGDVAIAIADNDELSIAGTGLQAEYYNNIDFTDLVLTRTDATIDFAWGSGSPDPIIGSDTFSVRWAGQIESLYSETYTFYATSDDGVRLWVDDELLIDGFVDQPPREYSGTIDLLAGQKYDIRMEYYENGGGAVAQLAWSSATQAKEIVPQSQLYLPAATFSLKDSETVFVSETAGFATVTAVRSGDLQEAATLEYTTNELTGAASAEAGSDYTQPTFNNITNTGQVVFEAGVAEKSFTIPISNDGVMEEPETFAVGIQNPSEGTLGAPRTVLVTILDDDSPTELAVSDAALTVSEDSLSATITVQRSGNVDGETSVVFSTQDGDAIAGEDYTATSGTLTFAPGEVTQTLTIPLQADLFFEGSESFSVTLSNPEGAALGSQTTTTVTILDDDSLNLTRQTVLSGLHQPTMVDWTPDGRYMIIAQKNGVVRVAENGTLRSTPLVDLSSQVNDTRDRGLLGMTIHPDFANTPYVYLLYTYDPPETEGQTGLAGPDGNGNRPSRLVRVTVDPNTMVADPDSLVVLTGTNSTWENTSQPTQNSTGNTAIDPSGIVNGTTITVPNSEINVGTQDNHPNLPGIQNQNVRDYLATDSESHSIGSVHFGPDGLLYLSNGDGTSYNFMDPRTVRVQDLSNLSGKVLRIDPITGAGVADNPFFDGDPHSNQSKVFYYGTRNPFRFTFDPVTGLPVVGDVGWNRWEEINTGAPGSNFGWPYLEGTQQTGGYKNLSEALEFYSNGNVNPNSLDDQPAVAPFLARSHGAPDRANAIMVGDFYNDNTLMFGDVNNGTLYAATLDSDREVVDVEVFDANASFIVDMEMGPDNQLYGVNLVSGEILRWQAS